MTTKKDSIDDLIVSFASSVRSSSKKDQGELNDFSLTPKAPAKAAPKAEGKAPAKAVEAPKEVAKPPAKRASAPAAPPSGWRGPTIMACGHMQFVGSPEAQKAAKDAGFCCAQAKQDADNGMKFGRQVHWEVKGLTVAVPEGYRRSSERSAAGFSGLCCDPKNGLYIGGIGNDCRHYHSGPERCEVHGVSLKSP